MSKELLLGFLTKAYNRTEDEIASLIFNGDELKENALQSLIDLDAQKVKRLKEENTKMFDNGYKKAQKEVLTDYEKKLKTTFGVEEELIGDDLINKIKETATAQGKGKVKELTDDEIKKHPTFLDYERKWKKEKEEAVTAKENEFVTFRSQIERSEKINKVRARANDIFGVMKPILPADVTKAEKQKILFFKQFDEYDYEISNDKDIFMIKDGKRLENSNGYPILLDDFVKERIQDVYELQKQDAKGGTGNRTETKRATQSGSINMFPKTQSEFGQSLLALGNDNVKIKELKENFDAINK